MEDNVALDSSKQTKFLKSIKGIKKDVKKNKNEPVSTDTIEKTISKEKKLWKRRKPKGLVYLSHIPHGFYEHQMTQYFKQFGGVTNARVIRSKRTGNSKGCAFVEFAQPAVAQIVAETMNNYLMGKRIIKAVYIPPEKQRRAMRMNWTSVNNPGSTLRFNIRAAHNAVKSDSEDLKKVKHLLKNLSQKKKKLKEIGINYDFFTPVDMPDVVIEKTQKEVKSEVDAPEKSELTLNSSKQSAKKVKVTGEKLPQILSKNKQEVLLKKTSDKKNKKENTVEISTIKKSKKPEVEDDDSIQEPAIKKQVKKKPKLPLTIPKTVQKAVEKSKPVEKAVVKPQPTQNNSKPVMKRKATENKPTEKKQKVELNKKTNFEKGNKNKQFKKKK